MDRVSTLAKSLASDQLKVRRAAQIETGNVLSQGFGDESDLPTYTEILALCKGLHYSLWMQDKLLLKEEVVARICEILSRIQNQTVLVRYFNAMFEMLAREWDKLDSWRVDKFMLLTRDFFNTGLQFTTNKGEGMWSKFILAIFDKVLDKDTQHAIGLKLHMCTVLGEELCKKKVKSFCVVSTLLHLVKRLKELPRHHSYAHALLRLIFILIRCLRRHANPSLDALIDCANKYTTERGGHRKSFRRVANALASIRESKQAKMKAAKLGRVNTNTDSMEKLQTTTPMETDQPADVESKPKPVKQKKRKNLEDPVPKKTKKRRLTPEVVEHESTEGLAPDEILTEVTTNTDLPVTPSKNEVEDKPKLENISVLPVSPVRKSVQETIDTNHHTESPSKELPTATPNITEPVALPILNTPGSSQRRVSFGKVFRKKFKTTQRLSMTPTVKTTPAKGILRERSSTGTKSRLSL